eukprot:1021196-Amorphochlora_amoeboformis.AAC.1
MHFAYCNSILSPDLDRGAGSGGHGDLGYNIGPQTMWQQERDLHRFLVAHDSAELCCKRLVRVEGEV